MDQTKKEADDTKAAATATKNLEKDQKANAKAESTSEHATSPTLTNSDETVNSVPTTAVNAGGPKVFPGPITTVPKSGTLDDGIKAPGGETGAVPPSKYGETFTTPNVTSTPMSSGGDPRDSNPQAIGPTVE